MTGFTFLVRPGQPPELRLPSPTPTAAPWLHARWARDERSDTTAVLVGRLFYKADLRARLAQPPATDEDADLALAAYRQAGPRGLEWLEGEFSLVVWDGRERSALALRDPFGCWPLYWAQVGGSLAVGTSLDQIGSLLPERALDLDYVAEYLMRPTAIAELECENVPFVGARRVPHGTLLRLRPEGPAERLAAWDWAARIRPVAVRSLEEAGRRAGELLRAAVRERVAGGPVAAHLSGGMDSSAVACLARDLLGGAGPLHTTTFVYSRPSLAGERAYAQMVVDQAPGIAPRFLPGEEALDFDWFRAPLPDHEEPYGWLPRVGADRQLVQAAHEAGAATLLTGIGADELFDAGPSGIAEALARGNLWGAVKQAAAWARAENRGLLTTLSEYGLSTVWSWLFPGGLRRRPGTWPRLGWHDVPPWLCPDFVKGHKLHERGAAHCRRMSSRPFGLVEGLLGIRAGLGDWNRWWLAAPRGMDVSHPFRDPRLVCFALGLPESLRAVPGGRKPVLQEATRGVLPEAIRTRPDKRHFNDVYWVGLARHLDRLRAMVRSSPAGGLGIFDPQALLAILDRAAAGTGDARASERVNKTLALVAWFDQPRRAALWSRTVRPGAGNGAAAA